MKKILVVDDDPDILTLLKFRLGVSDFDLLFATNEEDALVQAAKRPDLVLLDIMMPSGKEGYVIFSKLRMNEATKNIPVIFLSRKTEERDAALKMGASFFIGKPYDGADLIKKIYLALDGKKESLARG